MNAEIMNSWLIKLERQALISRQMKITKTWRDKFFSAFDKTEK
jgi:hypothetical protein